MPIEYTNTIDMLKPSQLHGFFVGWPTHPDTETHYAILQKSDFIWLAMADDRCIGFINALSDQVFYAFIPLLEVLPEYQGQGIGAELVERMTNTLQGMYAIDIICDEDVVPFYRKSGFTKCTAMIKRDFENQTGCH